MCSSISSCQLKIEDPKSLTKRKMKLEFIAHALKFGVHVNSRLDQRTLKLLTKIVDAANSAYGLYVDETRASARAVRKTLKLISDLNHLQLVNLMNCVPCEPGVRPRFAALIQELYGKKIALRQEGIQRRVEEIKQKVELEREVKYIFTQTINGELERNLKALYSHDTPSELPSQPSQPSTFYHLRK